MRGEVHVAARDDVEELAAGSQHPQPVHKLRTPLQNVFLWVGLKEVSITPHAHSFKCGQFCIPICKLFLRSIHLLRGLTFSPDGNQVNVFARVILIMGRSAVSYDICFSSCSRNPSYLNSWEVSPLVLGKLGSGVHLLGGRTFTCCKHFNCHVVYKNIYQTVNRLRSILSSCRPVILSSCHHDIMTSCQPHITLNFQHYYTTYLQTTSGLPGLLRRQ